MAYGPRRVSSRTAGRLCVTFRRLEEPVLRLLGQFVQFHHFPNPYGSKYLLKRCLGWVWRVQVPFEEVLGSLENSIYSPEKERCLRTSSVLLLRQSSPVSGAERLWSWRFLDSTRKKLHPEFEISTATHNPDTTCLGLPVRTAEWHRRETVVGQSELAVDTSCQGHGCVSQNRPSP